MSPPAHKKTPSEERNGMRSVPAELHPMSSFFYKRERGVEMETISVQEGMCRVCDLWARSGYMMCEILL